MNPKKARQLALIIGFMVIALGAIVVIYFVFLSPATQLPELTASLSEVTGLVQIRAYPGADLAPATNGMALSPGGEIITGDDGRARVDISNGTIIRLVANTYFTLDTLDYVANEPLTRLRVEAGRIWIILMGGVLEADTPSGVASLRGSYLDLIVEFQDGQGSTFTACLEGDCSLTTNAGVREMIAGQTAKSIGLDKWPEGGVMTKEMVEEFINNNPEAKEILAAVTATVKASRGDIPLPDLPCLYDGTCQSYCLPPGWDIIQGLPSISAVPGACFQAALDLMWYGVDPELFYACVILGGDPQTCANNAYREIFPIPDAASHPVVTLPNLPCIATNNCNTYCLPAGWTLDTVEPPPASGIPGECIAAAENLFAQGVDPYLFLQCVYKFNDPQGCADAAALY